MTDLEVALKVAQKIYPDAKKVNQGIEQSYGVIFNPLAPETTIKLMEKLNLEVYPCYTEFGWVVRRVKLFSDKQNSKTATATAATIQEAVYNCTIQIVEYK